MCVELGRACVCVHPHRQVIIDDKFITTIAINCLFVNAAMLCGRCSITSTLLWLKISRIMRITVRIHRTRTR